MQERPTDVDNYLQIIDSNNDELNDDVHEIGSDNISINEFFENIKCEAQSVLQKGEDINFFLLT